MCGQWFIGTCWFTSYVEAPSWLEFKYDVIFWFLGYPNEIKISGYFMIQDDFVHFWLTWLTVWSVHQTFGQPLSISFYRQEALILMNYNWCAGRWSIRLALFLNRYFDQITFIFDRTMFGFGDSKIWYEMLVKFAMVTMPMIDNAIRKTYHLLNLLHCYGV